MGYMNNNFRYMALLLFFLAIQVITAGSAHAIPAFSREHNTECATCHTIFPELNEYGDAFLKNGFVWNKQKKGDETAKPEKASVIKGEGDPELLSKLKEIAAVQPKSVNGESQAVASSGKSEPLWLAGLPQTVPISISGTLNASYNDYLPYDKVDLSTRAVSLLSGGVIKDKIGFFLKYNLYAEGAFDPSVSNTPINSSPPNANDIEEFYLVWRNALGTPINLKAGRFRPQLSLWKKSNKTGISDFPTTSYRVDRSNFSPDSTEDALEANAILFNRLFLAAGGVDRNGQETNEGYAHVSLKIGGSDFRAKEPDLDLDNESIFDYMYLVIGGYGYSGRNSISLASTQRNNFYRTGVDLDLVIKSARLRLAWAKGQDNNPDFSSHIQKTTDIYSAQGDLMFTTELLGFFRYEHHETWDGQIVQRYVPALVYAPIQNTKVTLEYQYTTSDSSPKDSSMLLLGIRAAF
jgi:hypothetical protein